MRRTIELVAMLVLVAPPGPTLIDVAPAQTLVRTSQMWGTEKTEGQVGAAVGRLLKVRSSSSASLKVARSCYTRSRPSIYEWPSVKESILDALRASKKK